MGKPLTDEQREQTLAALAKHGMNKDAIGRELGIARSTVAHRLNAIGITSDKAGGAITEREIQYKPLPKKGKVNTYLISCAVNNTSIHTEFWRNLNALRNYYAKDGLAEIIIGRIRYNLPGWKQLGGDERRDDDRYGDVWYDPAILPHILEDRVELAPGLHWCGDCPNAATAVTPLSGLETYAGENSGIFAATKLQMTSVATGKSERTKFNYSTGAVTRRHYSDTKTGQKASWHHSYSFVLVEVDSDGDWFARPLVADNDGAIHDLNIRVDRGKVNKGVNLLALTPGDIHVRKLDQRVKAAVFGPGGMVDDLRPEQLHAHDTHDHDSRNHHNRRDPFKNFSLHVEDKESVRDEIREAAEFYREISRPWMKIYDIWSNHSEHIYRWLKETDWRVDPPNMAFYLDAARAVVDAIERGEKDFNVWEWACRREGCPDSVTFLKPDQSHKVAGIECGAHGDKGPNGSRGSIRNIAKTGSKANIGHSHTAGIYDGCYQCGVTAGALNDLDMGYNEGFSSWSRTMIGTFANGKRTMITMRGLKYRAKRGK